MSGISPGEYDSFDAYVDALVDRIEQLEANMQYQKSLVADLVKHIKQLEDELDNERARGIHSCGPNCQRIECKQRRKIEQLEEHIRELLPLAWRDHKYSSEEDLLNKIEKLQDKT